MKSARLSIALACALAACNQSSAPDAAPEPATAQAEPASFSMRVGEATVHALLDGRAPFPVALFSGITPAEALPLLKAGGEATTGSDGKPAWHGIVWAFLVESGGKRVLIDTGIGAGGGFATALAAARARPDQIDAIAITHMHSDHVGGLLDGDGKAVFPRATLHINAAEADYWGDPANAARAPAETKAMFDAARRILSAYRGRLRTFSTPTEIAPGLTADPLIGHTPGHSVYRLSSAGQQMIFIGDMIHSLAVQMPRPAVTLAFDSDANRARAARLGVLRDVAGRSTSLAGPHFRPGIATIAKADGDAYRATAIPR